MPVIDADTHVDETEATWEHLVPGEERFRPNTLEFAGGRGFVAGDARPHRLWQIDGQFRLRRWRDDARTGTTRGTRELTDIEGRLRQMDKLGVDVQVLYPTLFLGPISTHPAVELALFRSYNRWIAQATAAAGGRLRWVALIPFLSPAAALEELRFAAANGACGVFKKGIEYGAYHAADPLFHPVYAEAARLNLPICIHTGSGDPRHADANTGLANNAGVSNLTAIAAFTSLVLSGIPDRFPDLRFGWIEASASWLPYLIHDLEAKRKRLSALHFDLKQDLLRSCRFYITCDTLDDLPYILNFGAEDSLMVGSDYGHADQSAEFDAVNVIRAKGRVGAIDPASADKIVIHNPARFYGI